MIRGCRAVKTKSAMKDSFLVLRCVFDLKSRIDSAMLKAFTVSIVLTQPS